MRPRRLRASKLIRDAVAETSVDPSDFIYPIFVKPSGGAEPIPSMPGQRRWPVGEPLVKHVEEALTLEVNKFILFGVMPDEMKNPLGSGGYDPEGVVPKALRLLKDAFGDKILLFADVCLCEYTDHGHCGVVKERRGMRYVDNDETIKLYAKEAVAYADAGADFVAPSGMMDGQVAEIRKALDTHGFYDVGIMAYSATRKAIRERLRRCETPNVAMRGRRMRITTAATTLPATPALKPLIYNVSEAPPAVRRPPGRAAQSRNAPACGGACATWFWAG